MNVRSLLVLPLLLLTAACATRRIPGTDIEDSEDSRAILTVMERYRAALEAKDAKAIQALVSESFREDAGTETLEDDLTYANLPAHLQNLFSKLDNPKVDINVRRVQLLEEENRALAIYYWNASWRLPTLTSRSQSDSELEQMVLEKRDGQWKIISGI
ncbi:nuclear transport factor 2 family protein [Stigmatella sp. ncwal1]|uniref:Nuclear transport factor 2 family protein n=1 Tax=Stigmatella ashevillensis TaxID=2995309 RepID=A0ABT5DP20_9BACT|nr:nuclear transport factor 2 family protein [Stigmatella ashevillena]MDC0714905.1 nuclear transport factor 2 family protein [Stigmatella ashevillena]